MNRYIGVLGIFAILCIFSFLRLHFQTNNYFDYAIYNNLIFNSIDQNYWMLFFGHFQPLIIFFSLILNLYESNFIANLIGLRRKKEEKEGMN